MAEDRSPRFINMSNSNEKKTNKISNESHAHRGFNLCKSHGGGQNERDRQSFVISKVSRKDLEDRFYSAVEKNLVLKQLLNKRDEKLKLLGTKLYRLTQQLKKEPAAPEYFQPFGKALEEQSIRIEQLQCEKRVLSEKINVLKRQISTQKNLISTAKNYKPKRFGSLERPRIINGKGKPDTKQEKQEDNDYFILLEEQHPNSPVPDDEDKSEINGDDEEFESENDTEKNEPIESKAPENSSEQLKNSSNKINDPTTSRVSFFSKLKCAKSKLSTKDIQVQTSLDKVSKIPNEDTLSEQLAKEHMLVLDLQQQLKSAQLTQQVVNEVEELVKVLSQNKNIHKERKVSSSSSFSQKEPTSMVNLRQELQKEKIDLQAQKKMNEHLMTKLSEMQKELDNLNIKFKRASSTSPKIFGHRFSPPKSPKHNAISDKSVTPRKNTDENFNNGTISKNTNYISNKNADDNFSRCTSGSTNKNTNDISIKTTIDHFNSFTSDTANSNKIVNMSNQNTKAIPVKIVKNNNNTIPLKSGRITSGFSSGQSDKSSGEESDKSDVINKTQNHANNNIYSKSDQNANNVSVKSDKNIPQDVKSVSASTKIPPLSRTSDPIDNTIKQESLPQNNKRGSSLTMTSKNDSIIKRELTLMTEGSNFADKAKLTPTEQSDILSTNTEIINNTQPIAESTHKVTKSGASLKNGGWGSEEIIWSTVTLSEIKENEESFDDATYDISKATTFTSQSSSPRHTDSTNDDLLSDGEVPKKKSRQSIKYSQDMNSTQETLIPKSEPSKSQGALVNEEKTSPESVSEKVEITLTAISKELNRCSELLGSKDHKECNCPNNKKKTASKIIGQSKSTTLVQSDTTNEDLSEGEIPKNKSLDSIKIDEEMNSKSQNISTIIEENKDESINVVPPVTEVSQIIQSEQKLSPNPTNVPEEVKCNEKGYTKDPQVCDYAEHEVKEITTDSPPSSQPKLNDNSDSSKMIGVCKTPSLMRSLGSIYSSRQSKKSNDGSVESMNKAVVHADTKLSSSVTDGNRSLVLVKVKLHTSKESPKKKCCCNQDCPKDKECICANDEANHYSPHRSQQKLSDKSQSSVASLKKKSSIEDISIAKEENISKSRETVEVEVESEAIHIMETAAPAYKEPAKKMNCKKEGCLMGSKDCTCDDTKVSSRNEISQNSQQDVDSYKLLPSPESPKK